MTLDEMKALPKDKQKLLYERIKAVRHKGKTTVYSATYGVGKVKLARTLNTSEAEADKLLKAYWKRNWAIKACADDLKVKTINGQMWMFNPVSKFWYSLRYEKDRWSTLNQSTGTYCFDTWVSQVRKIRSQLTGQFHDEIILEVKKDNREVCKELLLSSIEKVNKRLKLNVKLSVDVQFGQSYADIH